MILLKRSTHIICIKQSQLGIIWSQSNLNFFLKRHIHWGNVKKEKVKIMKFLFDENRFADKNRLFWHEFWTKLQILGKRCMLRVQVVKKYFCPMKKRNFLYTGLLCATKYMARTRDQRQSILAIFSNFLTGSGGQNGWNWPSLILCPNHILDRTAKSSISKNFVFHRAKMLIYYLGP